MFRSIIFSFCIAGSLADFLGPTYPPPRDFCSEGSLIHKSWTNLSTTLDKYLDPHSTEAPENLQGASNVTFSFGLFSMHDPAAASLQYHHTAPQIRDATVGTKKVDGDSIYRIASVSKLITAFAGLLELTEEEWNRPVTEIFPGFAEYAKNSTEETDPWLITQWEKVTPWTLASQLAGVATLGIPSGDQLLARFATPSGINWTKAAELGLPQVDINTFSSCLTSNCTASEFIETVRSQPPVFLPSTTPAYSDEGFMLLGIVISQLTGKSMDEIYQQAVFKPLGMSSSNSIPPKPKDQDLTRSVVAGNYSLDFGLNFPVTTPSGGIFSTINDLSKLGTGILNSTILPANETRKWMKPHSHTASLSYSVGAPWEIIRYIHPSTGKVTDLYTKLGDSGNYGGALVLIPDYDAGFSMLNAWSNPNISAPLLRSQLVNAVLDQVTESVLPALEAQAAQEAVEHYAGTYVSSNADVNSSIAVSFDKAAASHTLPGLVVSSWISNGTDMLEAWVKSKSARLLPTILDQPTAPEKTAFQLSANIQTNTYGAGAGLGAGPFSGEYITNFDWETVDSLHYGGKSLKLFVFDINNKETATDVEIPALKIKFRKQS